MGRVPERLRFHADPIADPKAVVTAGKARFTVLTPRCVRMEWSDDGAFEDRPSRVFWFRRQPVPRFTVTRSRSTVTIRTDTLSVRYDSSCPGLTADSLTVTLRGSTTRWRPGDTDPANLGGTARTLDGAHGPRDLETGLLSRSGLTVIDDSDSFVFDNEQWPAPRAHTGAAADLYAFACGSDYQACLRDFTALSGPVPLVPRWALGNWWSRYWAYADQELTELMQQFRARHIPLSVCVIDMDWHVVKNTHSRGWTGYTWNKELFPRPARFLKRMHDEFDLKISLNLHPADGVHAHEDAYPKMARHMGIDPRGKKPVPFDCTDPRFVDGYFRYLHHPHERLGVDFWWMDWQQGTKTGMEGLDPLFWLNHLHFLDCARDGAKRPFVFSRWAGLGNHRYQIGFSGDTIVSWESLAFQPYFTATASNVAYAWWSHDIGGHFWGTEDPELYTRWVQYGVFSPVFRIHTSKNRFQDRHPWVHGTEAYHVSRDAMRLRHALVPYLYSMNRLTHERTLPLVRPMYWSHPKAEEAYHCPNQYWFGTELVAAPFVTPSEPSLRQSRQVVWLPPGDWYGFDDGARYEGNRRHAVYGRIEDMPVFARAGAIVPLAGGEPGNGTPNPAHMRIRAYAGADNRFELYEDDGETTAHERGECCITPLELRCTATRVTLTAGKPRGSTKPLPSKRAWTCDIYNVKEPSTVAVTVAGKRVNANHSYDPETGCVTVTVPAAGVSSAVRVVLTARAGLLRNDTRRAERIHQVLHFFALHTNIKYDIFTRFVQNNEDPRGLREYMSALTDAQARCLCELLFDAGMELVEPSGPSSRRIVLWNARRRRDIVARGHKGHARRRVSLEPVPPFAVGRFEGGCWDNEFTFAHGQPWHCALDYAGVAIVSREG